MILAYPYGLIVSVNGAFDGSEAQVFPVQVIGRWVSHGKSTAYHLSLAPWGPSLQPTDKVVSRSTYDSVARSNRVQVWLREGALGLPWYTVKPDAP